MIKIKKLVKISHTNRNFKRYIEILHIVIKYGFGGFLAKLPIRIAIRKIKKIFNKLAPNESVIADMSMEARFRVMLELLGPTFIKLGQILSTRPDLIPVEFALELSKLQDKVPFFDEDKAFAIIKKELKIENIDEVFDHFDPKPFAAASIGQVYRAVYKGQNVVVKVQRPNIEKLIEVDLEIIMHLSLLAEKHFEELHTMKPSAFIEEFANSLEREIDFLDEAKETKRFLSNIEGEKGIYCPKIIDELTTSKVMVSEFIDGIKPNNLHMLETGSYDRKLLAENMVDSVLKQIFEYGFFHADPHPGNILIMPDNTVCFIDFGMVGRISPNQKEIFASLIMNVINKNSRKIADIFLSLTHFEEEPDRDSFERDLYIITDEYLLHDIKDIDFGRYFTALMNIFARYKLRIKPEIFLLLKAFVSLEKTGKILAPDINLIDKAAPFVKKIYVERFNAKKMMLNLLDPINDGIMLANDFPGDVRDILKKLKSGNFKIDVNYKDQNLLRKTMQSVSSQVTFAIVLAALIIGQGIFLLKPSETLDPITSTFVQHGFVLTVIIGFLFLLTRFIKKS
ncbi:MAG TPA: ABC transporter [Lentisphaeria bacterium]|nr:MAG: hypothetical protein A2X47_07085 [Lentisphaerae bacterium GWF2_38_69]HBM15605.1 ABC transporter [Lentisphaeria bacterium]